ncbi:undecaprenyl-diphosphate phosphatase [Neobacillus vireti]|uniref:Undecaprenyl-diphosphatase n=1 Tax=Neobacillus vireti LMG 21834 TaxID=1131730 RepID=A0AB94IN15_9BACI|nr:undecaprenyl-diphosphate phosphatase [Neobacillus vireti]ETI68402.1 undecaprenyl pyrophosphate phosphatase [Neobacillus vireti LMG 21834]KLT16350.1 UDP pyrophosphate phosphatase [Neobacillus vireti]
MSENIIAFILGIVEGLTEFLPISSTGHLILVGNLLGFEGEKANTFEVIIQLGSMLAILVLYWKRYLSLLNFSTIGKPEKKLDAIHIILGVLPAALVGLLLHNFIKNQLFSPNVVVVSLIAGAILMIFAEKKHGKFVSSTVDELSYKQALTIGLFQCLAVIPGFSRAGSTISGGLLAGANHKTAAEFSFLVALPIMVGATGLDLIKSLHFLHTSDIPMFAIGFVTAFVVAMCVAIVFIKVLAKIGLTVFAYYRIALAALFIIFVIL